MKKILLTLCYDGTGYHGWQTQKNSVSVQGILENALQCLFGVPVKTLGASRTDTGVHALDQKASFFIEEKNLKIPPENLPLVINSILPEDITVKDACFVNKEFNPRYDAQKKIYRYQILNQKYRNPLLRNYAWHIHHALDMDKMKSAAAMLTGTHDFRAFCASGSSSESFVRSLYSLDVTAENPFGQSGDLGLVTITVCGDGFLYNMVRIIAGTLMYCGCGKIPPDDIPEIIRKKDRKLAGITAPANGLTLLRVILKGM